jgi:hypothetical protein
VDWGNFNAPLRNDRADAPHMVQAGATMNPILSTNFTMSDGGITGVELDGIPTGYSKNVQQSSGRLEFTRDEGSKPCPNTYCIQVRSTEKHVFCDWSDYVASELE